MSLLLNSSLVVLGVNPVDKQTLSLFALFDSDDQTILVFKSERPFPLRATLYLFEVQTSGSAQVTLIMGSGDDRHDLEEGFDDLGRILLCTLLLGV
jgi:hypothetical protein